VAQHPPRRSPLLALLLTLFVVIAVLFLAHRALPPQPDTVVRVADIGLEHAGALRLSVTASRDARPGFLEISHDGKETAFLSVPADWELREVRNAELASIPADPPSFGFRRWKVPGGAVLSFVIPAPSDGILLHNPSKFPVEVRTTLVHMRTQKIETETMLMKDNPLRLW
jgi:hypothetical protein